MRGYWKSLRLVQEEKQERASSVLQRGSWACNTCVRESGDVRIRELNSGDLGNIVSGI